MRTFVWRWRLLLVGVCLAVLGSLGVFLLELVTPDSPQLSFGRVQLGMAANDVNALMNGSVSRKEGGKGALFLFPDEQFPRDGTPLARELTMRTIPDYALTAYGFESGQVTVVFRNDRVAYKSWTRYRTAKATVWGKVRVSLGRLRAAVGL
jgi:hypothetical protein